MQRGRSEGNSWIHGDFY
ncbi:hypothetical protein FG170_20955 [Serratia marcescens]|nr:hypothetical protein FG170_20955 [Serratia marcescens]TXE71012.1 hypothetical protein FOT59_18325 [Serratia nevei]